MANDRDHANLREITERLKRYMYSEEQIVSWSPTVKVSERNVEGLPDSFGNKAYDFNDDAGNRLACVFIAPSNDMKGEQVFSCHVQYHDQGHVKSAWINMGHGAYEKACKKIRHAFFDIAGDVMSEYAGGQVKRVMFTA